MDFTRSATNMRPVSCFAWWLLASVFSFSTSSTVFLSVMKRDDSTLSASSLTSGNSNVRDPI